MTRLDGQLPEPLRTLAIQQHQVTDRDQLRELGVTDRQIGSRCRQGAWSALGPRVVVLHNGPLSGEQQLWAGVLHAGPEAVLCMGSAATAGGLTSFASRDVHVAVEHGREIADLELPSLTVRVHQTRHLGQDVKANAMPRRYGVGRSVVEAASVAATDNRVRALIAASVQQGLVRPEHLRAFVATRPTLPRRRLVLETIDDVEGGSHSLPEIQYLRGLRRARLPMPTRQEKVKRKDGTWYLDNHFAPWGVVAEVNGAQHFEVLIREADDIRRAILQIRGSMVVDLSSYLVRHRIRVAMLLTAEALRSRGWQPATRTAQVLNTYAVQEDWVGL